ncbi:hypothetical protein N7528_004627 [Penicillium herquei]|nr:hypothetical protein N7528_004627 [Penicillium herquei]
MRSLCASSIGRLKLRPRATVFHCQQRTFKAAVVGGGVTGLTAAWQLSHDPQCSEVTVYEKSPRLGGWMSSELVSASKGDVLFEYGPRTLKSGAESFGTWWLANQLEIQDDIIWSPMKSGAAMNRYLYYPDHLVRVPAPLEGLSMFANIKYILKTLRNEPVFDTVIPGIIFESFKPPRTPDQWSKDESVAEFISRRFTPEMAENLVSAFMHGIYAGDIDKLSAQALLGRIRNLDDTGIVRGIVDKIITPRKHSGLMDHALFQHAVADSRIEYPMSDYPKLHERIRHKITHGATFSFKRGTQQLTDGLADALTKSPKVNVRTNSEVQSIRRMKTSENIYITAHGSQRHSYDRVIASLPAPALAGLLGSATNHPDQFLPHQSIKKLSQHNYATSVMVVNLYYPNLDPAHFNGFGYLIPRSIPYEQNPECALGVIFATASSVGLNFNSPLTNITEQDITSQDTAPGVKFTVMMGGHYWDHWKDSDYPDHESATKMARSVLERHLGITAEPELARSRMQKNAIPQYTVGHLDRMYDLSKTVREEFHRRLILAGNWYTGVGVNDCVRSGLLAGSFGTGSRKLSQDPHIQGGWREHNFWEWNLEGGIPTAPVPWL